MAQNSIIGKVAELTATESKTTSAGTTFQTRELVLDCTIYDRYTGEPRENFPKFDVFGDLCDKLDGMKGKLIQVSFALNGVKYTDKQTNETKYFTKIKATKIEEYATKNVETDNEDGADVTPF